MFELTRKEVVVGLFGAGLGFMTSVAGGVATGYLQLREPELYFNGYGTHSFETGGSNVALYVLNVYNAGKKEAEEVDCQFEVPGSNITSHLVIPSAIAHTYEETNGKAKIHLPTLNPGEAISLQALATGPIELPVMPKISVRGKGVTGWQEENLADFKRRNEDRLSWISLGAFITTTCVLISLAVGAFQRRPLAKPIQTAEGGKKD